MHIIHKIYHSYTRVNFPRHSCRSSRTPWLLAGPPPWSCCYPRRRTSCLIIWPCCMRWRSVFHHGMSPDYGDYYRGCAYCRLDDSILHFFSLFSFLKSCRTEESGVGDIFKEHASKFSEVSYIFGSFMDHMPIKIAPCVTYCAPCGPYILFILPLP